MKDEVRLRTCLHIICDTSLRKINASKCIVISVSPIQLCCRMISRLKWKLRMHTSLTTPEQCAGHCQARNSHAFRTSLREDVPPEPDLPAHAVIRQHTRLPGCRRNERVRSKQAQMAADEWARIDALKAAQAAQQGADISDACFALNCFVV
jgi:hypothetical protein